MEVRNNIDDNDICQLAEDRYSKRYQQYIDITDISELQKSTLYRYLQRQYRLIPSLVCIIHAGMWLGFRFES